MEKFLERYFNLSDIKKIKKKLSSKSRVNFMTELYFVKCAKNTGDGYSDNLLMEINLYKNNKDVFDFYIDNKIDDNYILIVLRRIDSKSISKKRNSFNNKLTNADRISLIKKIRQIKALKLSGNLIYYSRREMLDKYFNRAISRLNKNQICFINKYKNVIGEDENLVISHGDLIMPNILMDKDVYFIDWEFAGYRNSTYDVAYFMLFSKAKNCFSYVDKIDIPKLELFKDAIIICLKEIQNWNKLSGKLDDKLVDSKINRWLVELDYIMEMMLYENIDNCAAI